ncbi:MAG: hypothetical protein LBQ90_00885 [Synergistaceae bacterium]|nr:hypothetical protein [Synergistaceae bacterium]
MSWKKKTCCIAGVGLSFLALWLAFAHSAGAQEPRRLSVVLFPTENQTDLEVWQSKYYPYSVLEQKMTEYLATLFYNSPLIDVTVLDENGMNRWLSQPYRDEDMALQMELYNARMKEREISGTVETGRVALRMKIYDTVDGERFATRVAAGKSTRYTFNPGDDGLFWIDTLIVPLTLPFKDGLDPLGLTRVSDKGQRMSRPTWQQFSGTSHWQSIKNAIEEGYHEAMGQVSNVIRRNDPDSVENGDDSFSPSFATAGRIISPTAQSTRKRREYIISLGRSDAIRVGDVLDVVRGDTYVTVDPEHPVVVMPQTIGKVRVVSVQEKNAVVRVIRDNKKEPVRLKDVVIKTTGPAS